MAAGLKLSSTQSNKTSVGAQVAMEVKEQGLRAFSLGLLQGVYVAASSSDAAMRRKLMVV